MEAERRRSNPARHRDLHGSAHGPWHRHGAGAGARAAGRVHEAALDLHARAGLGPRALAVQRPERDPRPALVSARRLPDRIHVQLVLRRLAAHCVHQLRDEPGQVARRESGPAGARVAPHRVEGVEPRHPLGEALPVRPAGEDDRPVVHNELEQQAGARGTGGGRQLGLRIGVPLATARPSPGCAARGKTRGYFPQPLDPPPRLAAASRHQLRRSSPGCRTLQPAAPPSARRQSGSPARPKVSAADSAAIFRCCAERSPRISSPSAPDRQAARASGRKCR